MPVDQVVQSKVQEDGYQKPSDTLNKFILMSKPSVGYKNIPLLWIEMIDVSSIVGFILPDWIADILPGDYPVHTKEGIVKETLREMF